MAKNEYSKEVTLSEEQVAAYRDYDAMFQMEFADIKERQATIERLIKEHEEMGERLQARRNQFFEKLGASLGTPTDEFRIELNSERLKEDGVVTATVTPVKTPEGDCTCSGCTFERDMQSLMEKHGVEGKAVPIRLRGPEGLAKMLAIQALLGRTGEEDEEE